MSSVGRQSEKRAAIEAAVLQATEDLLRDGATYAELNIERITTAAGISRTAFYFYFRDKRELLVRLTEEVSAQLVDAAESWWVGGELREALQGIAGIYADHAALLRAVVEVSTYDEAVAAHWRGLVGRFVDATARRLAEERGPEGAEAIAFALVWMVERSLYEITVQDDAIDARQLVDALAEIYARTVTAP